MQKRIVWEMDIKAKLKKSEKWIWLFVIVMEYMLFRSYAIREAVNYAPIGYDQSVYLKYTYDIYWFVTRGEYAQAWTYINSVITSSALLSVMYVVLFFLGYSRLSLLTVNFIAFVMMQLIGYKVLKKISSSTAIGVGFVGLTFMINTTFADYGGILDFRWDYMAFCIYTVWGALLLLWLHTKKKKYMYISAIVSGLLIFVRFYYALFIAGFVIIYYIVEFLKKRILFKTMMREVLVYAGVCAAAGGWSIFAFLRNFLSYVIGAGNSSMASVWNLSGGISQSIQHYIYWFFEEHLGVTLPLLLIVIIVLMIVCRVLNARIQLKYYIENAGYIFLVLLMPTVAFIIQASQNTAVLSVNIGILILIIMYLLVGVSQNSTARKQVKYLLVIVAFVTGITGALTYIKNTTREYAYPQELDVAAAKINESIVQYMLKNNMENASYMADRNSDIIYSDTIKVYAYEHYNKKIEIQDTLGLDLSVAKLSSDEIEQALSETTFLAVSRNGYTYASVYPMDEALKPYQERMYQYAKEEMTPILSLEYYGGNVTVYARKKVSTAIGYADGWMGVDNNVIAFTKDSDKQDKLILSGSCGYIDYDSLHMYVEELKENVNVEIDHDYWTYTAVIDISDLDVGSQELHLTFDNYFVPNELDSSNMDKRQLVLLEPQKIFIQ